jgi:hypothetical protein
MIAGSGASRAATTAARVVFQRMTTAATNRHWPIVLGQPIGDHEVP